MNLKQDSECGVEITVTSQYLQQKSNHLNNTYAFAYTVTIQNNRIEEVKGKGVVGQQPLIKPGESFQYSSGTIIGSEIGDMKGSYTMQNDQGETFEAPIPLFVLATPHMIH